MTPRLPSSIRQFRPVEEQLVPGEMIGWAGQPRALFYALHGARDWLWLLPAFIIPALFITLVSDRERLLPNPWRYVLLAALAGGIVLLLTFLSSLAQARRTVYAVTNLRVIIIAPYMAGLGRRTVDSYGHNHLGVVECEPFFRAIGDVILKRESNLDEFSGGRRLNREVEKIGLMAVDNACELANAIARYSFVAERE